MTPVEAATETSLTLIDNTTGPTEAFLPEDSAAGQPAQGEMPFAIVEGQPVTELPRDLYIPPHALEVFLEAFERPQQISPSHDANPNTSVSVVMKTDEAIAGSTFMARSASGAVVPAGQSRVSLRSTRAARRNHHADQVRHHPRHVRGLS